IARVEGTGMLYAEALENLWANFEMSGEDVEGQKLALTNVRYDSDIMNLRNQCSENQLFCPVPKGSN
ncbi:MAG: hypothetical protein R6U85_10215, partial [Salinivirgaceae bacterium]